METLQLMRTGAAAGHTLLQSNGMFSTIPQAGTLDRMQLGASTGQQVQVLPAAAPGTQYVLVQQPSSMAGLPVGVFPVGMHSRRPAEPSYDSDDSEDGDGRGGKGK